MAGPDRTPAPGFRSVGAGRMKSNRPYMPDLQSTRTSVQRHWGPAAENDLEWKPI